MKKILLSLLVAVVALSMRADGLLPDMTGRLLPVCNSHVNGMCQDHKGYIWLATDYGLSRFDGAEVMEFTRTDIGGALLSNSVLTVMEDSRHALWVGTMSGIQKLDPITLTFTTPRLSYPHVPDFSYVNSIIEDRRGNIWFTTSRSGAICLHPDDREPECFMTTNSDICSNKTSELFEDRFGNIWIGSMDSGVTVYNPENGAMTTLRHVPNDESTLSSDMIFSITQANDGRIFIGMPDGGIDSYDYRTNKVTRNAIPVDGTVYILKNVPEENALYIGTDGNGLFRYDMTSRHLSRVDVSVKDFDFKTSKIHDILFDRDGNLWLGVFQKGPMLAMRGDENATVNLGYNPFNPSLHTGTEPVLCVLQSNDGALWIGTDGDGIYHADHLGAPFRHMPVSVAGANVVLTFFQDSRGTLWAGNYLNGLTRYDRGSGKFLAVDLPSDKTSGGKIKEINAIAESPDGKLWLGTNGNGVCVYDPAGGPTKFYSHNPMGDPDRQLLGNAVHAIIFDGDGRVWIGTSDAGLSCLDPATDTFRHFNTSNMQLSNNCVLSLCQDASGTLWVGTRMGLNRIKDNHTRIFNTTHGLLDNLVYGITTDNNGHLWLSTGKGISCLNIDSMEFNNAISSTLTGNKEFKRGSACCGKDGRLYFGGVGGVVSFMPVSANPQRRLSTVDFYSLKVMSGKNAGDTIDGGVISLFDRSVVELGYDSNSFTVSFGAVEYLKPERVSYSVKLENHDQEWIELPRGVRVATWSLLPPGDYSLRVLASIDGFEPVEKALKLIVTPPFYLTVWAKIIYTVLSILALYGLYRFTRRKLNNIKERERQMLHVQATEMKLQYFTDISHEIRTPLTMILSPLESLRERTRDRETLRTLDVMQHNGNRILRLIDQIVDLRAFDNKSVSLTLRNVDLKEFINNLSHSFEIIAEQRNITFKTEISDDVPPTICIDSDKIDKVLFNVLGNAFKFTPVNGAISMTVGVEQGMLAVRVIDSGPGIPADSVDNIFNRFYRAPNAGANASGSGIGLHLSLKMMTLHQGSISVERTSPQGTTFLVRIPLDLCESPVTVSDVIEPEAHGFVTEMPDAKVRHTDDGVNARHATILIVEDSESIRGYLASKLSEHFNVVAVADGEAALTEVLKLHPDLVLTDIMMDGVDGLELCRKIRSNPATCEIPVVMLTAKITDSQKNEGILAGADAYITKPFNYVHLLNRINMLIHNRRKLKEKYSGETEANMNEDVVKIKSSDEKLMERVRKVVIEHIADPDLSVEFIADSVCVSRSHLHRRLKIVANMNPSEIIRSERMRHAATLLSTKNVGISEVAYATGFSTLSHFSTCFKEYFGMSPTRYVAIHRGSEAAPKE